MAGKDRAAFPPDLFIVSLGSCLAAFVANYCNNVGLDSSNLTVKMTCDKAGEPARLQNIKASINIPNADIDKRRRAIMGVAEHCILHETLTSDPEIEVTLE